jgi:hypothetical protein
MLVYAFAFIKLSPIILFNETSSLFSYIRICMVLLITLLALALALALGLLLLLLSMGHYSRYIWVIICCQNTNLRNRDHCQWYVWVSHYSFFRTNLLLMLYFHFVGKRLRFSNIRIRFILIAIASNWIFNYSSKCFIILQLLL